MDLTEKQQAVFDYLCKYRAEHRRPPSYEEIRRHFRFASLNSVRKHLLQLERKGFIRSPWGNQKRALEIVRGPDDVPGLSQLALMGAVAAGRPLEAVEIPETIEVPQSLLRRGEHFALQARGDSMIDDGIHDGDILVLQKREIADPGQTVVALVDGEATVKRFYRKGRQIELRPANPSYSPIVADEASVTVQGIVVALFRKYA